MPLAQPISISQQLKVLSDVFTVWAEKRGGRCSVMENQSHLWESLSLVTDYPQAMVMFVKETPVEPVDAGRVQRRFAVILVRGRGLTDPAGGGLKEPFTASVSSARDLGRSIVGISDSEVWPQVEYAGTEPLPNILPTKEANAFADAVMVSYNTVNDLPAVSVSQNNQPT